ncbi:HlyD family efflux transporter periplasmic adaptor subunit [uncultured Roseobacter sp.]|uniref:HlyD family efflux transporter periplasmic adaptor subunit n=1 Tax=uncultured Roseobacter sp. TaxID=114847 RepID=UPI00262C5CE2|nr:HlyD family efflux transporter periplasmic adaptor subunit [uncultured Roseobacter sp.]
MSISDRSGEQTSQPDSPAQTSDTGVVHLSGSLWSAFLNAKSDTAFLTGWLAVLVSKVEDARMGVLLQADPATAAFLPVAIVPDPRRDLTHLREIAESALGSGRPIAKPGENGIGLVAYPVVIGTGAAEAVIVMELAGQGGDQQQNALREMHWAAGWLNARIWENNAQGEAAAVRRGAVAIDILALVGEHQKPAAAAMAAVNELHAKLGYDHVAIGMVHKRNTSPRIKLLAMSHAAWFKKRSSATELLETAMEETFDQNGSVSYPPIASLERSISVAHSDLVKAGRVKQILSVPLSDEDGPVGILSVERRKDLPAFGDEDRLMLEAIAALLGPVLETKRRAHRWFAGRIIDSCLHALGVVLGPRRLSWKLLTLAIGGAFIAATVVTGPFRVQADAVIRGDIQRAATAPFAGFVAQAGLRAGDKVTEGQEIARLDDDDLQLEILRARAEIDRLTVQSRDALAKYERAQVAALEAQIEQARAQARLTESQIQRTRILAPISGVIVNGDLSQRLGAPVQAGEVLFEIVPEDAYRVEIYVDERDLRFVEVGRKGHLALSGSPSDALPLTVSRITPVAEAREGYNAFRIEANLTDPGYIEIRPGMEGRAKIEIEDRRYVWIWSRRMIDWVRQKLWTWQP